MKVHGTRSLTPRTSAVRAASTAPRTQPLCPFGHRLGISTPQPWIASLRSTRLNLDPLRSPTMPSNGFKRAGEVGHFLGQRRTESRYTARHNVCHTPIATKLNRPNGVNSSHVAAPELLVVAPSFDFLHICNLGGPTPHCAARSN